MIAKVQFHSNFYNETHFNSHMGLDLCFELINGYLFDMLRLLMRYLGNFCQITAVMQLIWIRKLSVFLLTL